MKEKNKDLKLSERAKNLGTENAFVVLEEVNELIGQGKDIISFCIGQPDFDTPQNIKDAAKQAIDEGRTGYTGAAGIPKLREAAAKWFSKTRKIKVEPDSIVITDGGKPFIMYSILSVADYSKKQEIIFPNPGFPIYESQTKAQGCKGVPLYLKEEKGFNFDVEELKEKVNDNTRLLILNSPQNPTGGVLSKKELEEIADVVLEKENLWVFSDEVYSQLVYDGEFQSIASVSEEMQERTIMVDCVSKTWAMTGWRLGFMSNKKLAKTFEKWVTNIHSCSGHPNQYAALEALTGPQNEPDNMYQEFKTRRDIIVEKLNEIEGIECLQPGGAFYVWPNVTELCNMTKCKDSEELRKRLLYEAEVAVLADIHFGPKVPNEGEHIRLSYATSQDKIKEGIEKIKDWVDKNK